MAKEEAKEIIDTPVEEVTEEKFAKAGKKSKKHVEEVKAEEERQARKAERAAEPEKKVGPKPVTRSRLERRGKNYRKANEKVEKNKAYSLEEAVKLAIETSPVKFDATLEMHFRLGVDPRQADQNIRATVTLPAGTGKDVRVAVFAPLDIAKAAKAAGADIAEDEEFTKRLDKEQLDFDVLISTPQYMPKLGKYARLLGPKGLMPNPKAGTVTTDIEKAVKETRVKQVAIAGGVSANSLLRSEVQRLGQRRRLQVFIPPFQFCTDNAAMVGIAGYFKYLRQDFADTSLPPYAR